MARRKKTAEPWNSGAFELEADNVIVDIVMLDIHTDLP
jgi:hypothetical protein